MYGTYIITSLPFSSVQLSQLQNQLSEEMSLKENEAEEHRKKLLNAEKEKVRK